MIPVLLAIAGVVLGSAVPLAPAAPGAATMGMTTTAPAPIADRGASAAVRTHPPASPPAAMLLETEASAALLQAGRRSVLSGRFEAGEASFYALALRPDGRPAAYHHLATTSLLRVMMFERKADYTQFFSRSDSLRDLLEELPRSKGRAFLEGETDFQRGLAWAKQSQYIRAAMAGVSAYRTLLELVDEDPEFWEAYKSLGIVQATLGTLPRRYRRFLSVFGFDTDLDTGLDQLETAIARAEFGREESLLFLSILDSYELPSRVDGADTVVNLWRENDRSPLFGAVLLHVLLRDRRVAEADEVLAALREESTGRIQLEYLDYFLAEIRLKQEAWTSAAEAYGTYLSTHQGTAYKAVSALNQGLALEMAGDRGAAENAYREALEGRDMDEDEASARLARRLLKAPMSDAARRLFQARMSHDRADYVRADSLLRALGRDGVTEGPAFFGEVAYRHGRVLDESGQDEAALTAYRRAIANPGDPSAKWAPYSLYYAGRIHAEAGRVREAREAYQAVLDYRPDYDYRGTSEQRARFALERLGR